MGAAVGWGCPDPSTCSQHFPAKPPEAWGGGDPLCFMGGCVGSQPPPPAPPQLWVLALCSCVSCHLPLPARSHAPALDGKQEALQGQDSRAVIHGGGG